MNELTVYGNTTIAQAQGFSFDYVALWDEYNRDKTEKTRDTYSRNIRPLIAYLQERGITQPQRADIVAYKESLLEDHKPATVQAYMIACKMFFHYCQVYGLYADITADIGAVKLDRNHKKDYLTSGQAKRVLSCIDRSTTGGKRDYAILSLMMTAGLRTIEVSRANIEDFRTAGNSAALYIQGKGHTERSEYVKIAEPVEAAIRDYLPARNKATGREPLFASEANRNTGERMTTRSISRLVKERFVAAGFDSDRLTAHSLRHTAATLNLLNGGTLEETQQLLRHTNISTTMIYSHALTREKNDSEARVAAAIFE